MIFMLVLNRFASAKTLAAGKVGNIVDVFVVMLVWCVHQLAFVSVLQSQEKTIRNLRRLLAILQQINNSHRQRYELKKWMVRGYFLNVQSGFYDLYYQKNKQPGSPQSVWNPVLSIPSIKVLVRISVTRQRCELLRVNSAKLCCLFSRYI